MPSRATGLLVGESWEAAFTEVPCVEEGAVAAVPLEDGGLTSVKGRKSPSDDERSSDSETEPDYTLKQPKLAKPGKPDQTTTAGRDTETI